MRLDPRTSHDLVVPVQHGQAGLAGGLRAGRARSSEPMVPTIEGEFARKRRMMSHAWPTVVTRRDARPARLRAAVRAEVFSHRLLRYATPLLHVVGARANVALVAAARGASTSARWRLRPRCSRRRGAGRAARRSRGRCSVRATTCS